MNAEVEQRIVEMRFDNEQFEKGAKQTLSTLEKLDNVLDMFGSGGGMDKLSSALDTMEYRFSRLGIAGAAAIERITGKVVGLASNLINAIPNQIIEGGKTRALNIENAKFQLKGLGIAWEEVADDIDHAVMGTAYGVDEAAKAAAILGASNVQYKNMAGEISDMGHVLRSISGIAAMTNSSYDDIADIMGDIFAMGKVTTGELQRFELRGLNVVAKLAEMSQNGTLKKIGSDAKYTETELRELISKGGIDALTFAKAMDAAFGEHATAANETFTGSLRNMKAALSRIGADFVTPTNEGIRKVMLSLRALFDRVRKITKPFAEGTYKNAVDRLSDTICNFLDSIDVTPLQSFVDLLERILPGQKTAKTANSISKIADEFKELGFTLENMQFGNVTSFYLGENKSVQKLLEASRSMMVKTGKETQDQISALKEWGVDLADIAENQAVAIARAKTIYSGGIDANEWLSAHPEMAIAGDGLKMAFTPFARAFDTAANKNSLDLMDEKFATQYLAEIYERAMYDKALKDAGLSLEERILEYDRRGIKIGDKVYSHMILDIGESAEKTAKAFELLGKVGGPAKLLELKEIADHAPKATNDLKRLWDVLKRIGHIFSDYGFYKIKSWAKDIADGVSSLISKIIKSINKLTIRFEDSKLRNFIFGTFDKRLGQIEKIIRSVAKTGIAFGEVVFAIISKIFNISKNGGVFKLLDDGFMTTTDLILKASDSLGKLLEKLRDLINNGSEAESSLGKIGHGFELVGNFVGGVITAISTFLRYILGIREGETIFSRFGRMFKTVGDSVRTVFGNIRGSIQGTFGEGGVGKDAIKIATALYTVLIGYRKIESKKFAFGRFSKAFEFLKDLLTKSYESIRAINPLQWADDIETLLRRTSGALRAFADNLNAKSLLTIAGAVVALSFGLTMLAAVAEGGHLTGALVALAFTMGLLIGAMAALKAITDQGLFKNVTKGWKGFIDIFKNSISKYLNAITLKETATALLLFTAAVGVLALAVIGLGFAFKSLSLPDIALAVATVGALMVLLTRMLVWINKATKEVGMLDSTKFIAIAAAFVGMALAVDLLALAVAGLTAVFNGSNVWAAIGAVGTIIVLIGALTGAMALLSVWTKEIGGFKLLLIATAMIGMALAVDLLALAVVGLSYAFQGLESAWPVIGAVVAIGAMLVAMAGTLAFLSSMLETVSVVKILAVSAALVLMSGAILVVAAAAIGFAAAMQMSEKWWHVLATMIGTLVAMAAVLGVLSLLGPKILIAAGAILAVGFAIKIACEGFVKLSEGMVVLAGALNMLPADGSLETLGKGMGKVAGGLAKIAAAGLIFPNNLADKFEALVPLASAMTLMSDIDFAPLADKEHGMPAAAKAIKSFGGLFGVGMSMLWGSSGLIAAGPGLLSLGEGLRNLAPGMQAFSAIENPEAVANTLKELAFAVTTLDTNSTFGNRDYLPQLAENLTKIANAISGLSADQVQAIRNLGAALSDAFTENSGQAAAALQTELTSLQQTLETGSEQFIIAARRFPMHIQSGIEDNAVIAENAMKKLIWDMCAAANSDEVRNNLRIIGGNIAIGIANGITSRTQEAANAMRRLASALQTSFTVSLQIRSPSRVFENLAEYIPQGIARGIQNGENGIADSMASSMSGAMNVLDQYSRRGDLAPTVTPVMDMAGMRRNIRSADRMFNASQMSNFNGLNGLTVSGDAISYNMQNRDVVNEIRNMTDRINRLGEAIQNMQMVLDSGVLVGQIGQQVNRELGTIAMRERRQ